jgi:hypothetical protein
MANQGSNQEISTSLGSVEPVPSRQCGHEDKRLLSPTQDEFTNQRRAHYGEDPAFVMHSGGDNLADNVNDVKTPANPTKADRIIPGTKLSNDGFYNHSCSG